jgi:ferrous iron transport protein B
LHQELTLGGAAARLVFFAFAMQCMSTIAVLRRETGGWFWPGVQFVYMTGLAYICAFSGQSPGLNLGPREASSPSWMPGKLW